MRRHRRFPILALIALGALAGCAAAPQVASVGGEVYRVSAEGSRFDSQVETNRRALSAASAYCAAEDKALLFRESQESGAGNFAPKREDLTFTCLSASDPGYLNAGLRRDTHHDAEPMLAQQ